jgi:type I restriction enzyme S subunit
MDEMRFYKETNFKDTEIGKIPKDWKVVRLGDIASIIMGQSPPSSTYNKEGRGLPFLQGKMEFGSTYPTFSIYTSKPIKIAEADDILISVRAPVGDVNLAPFKLCIGRGLAAIRCIPNKACHLYYFYFLQKIKELLEALGKGSTFKAIIKEDLVNLKIPLPPLSEQEKIAEILSTVDELIQRTEEIIAKTERLKKGLMQELLTKGIGHKEFKETEIGRIPKDWEVVRLGDIAADMYYGITAKAVNERTPLRMLRTTDIKDYKAEWDNLPFCQITERRKDIQKYFLQIGDLIISRAGTAGMSVLIDKPLKDVIFGSYLIKIKLKENVHPKYLQFFFRSRFYWDHILSGHAGSTLKNINLPVLKATLVILPPIPEQEKIAEILSTVDEKIEIERKRKEKLERIKKSLMDLLLTGKIRVRVD